MAVEKHFTPEEYKQIAENITSLVWRLLEQDDSAPEDGDRLIHAAHASRFHWGEFGEAIDIARSEWLLSHAYTKSKRPIPAFYHANKCLQVCKTDGLSPFTVAYGYEALARAAVYMGNQSDLTDILEIARLIGEQIEDEAEQKKFFDDLDTVPKEIVSLTPQENQAT